MRMKGREGERERERLRERVCVCGCERNKMVGKKRALFMSSAQRQKMSTRSKHDTFMHAIAKLVLVPLKPALTLSVLKRTQ